MTVQNLYLLILWLPRQLHVGELRGNGFGDGGYPTRVLSPYLSSQLDAALDRLRGCLWGCPAQDFA